MSQFSYEQNRVHVAPSGVHLDEYVDAESQSDARKRLGLPESTPVALYIGEFDAWKGVSIFLEAASSLEREGVLTVIIGGSTDEINVLKARYPSARFLGRRPQSELPHNQKAADVLLIPNSARYEISNRHTSPLKVFTSMASGVPIVATKTIALTEILTDENSTLIEPDAPEILSRTVVHVIRHHEEYKTKAARALVDVRHHDWSVRTAHIEKFMFSIMSSF